MRRTTLTDEQRVELHTARYQRMVRTLAHQQDAARVATATTTLAALKQGRKRAASRSPLSMNAVLPQASR